MNWITPRFVAVSSCIATFLFLLLSLSLTTVPHLAFYDEGVYFAAAALFNDGFRPYDDFLLVHPPGLMWFNAFMMRPFGLVGCRVAQWVLSVALAVCIGVSFQKLLHGSRYSGAIACLAVFFFCSSEVFNILAGQSLTQVPDLLLVQLGFIALVRERPMPVVAGICLTAATLFRIQSALVAPAWAVFVLTCYPRPTSWNLFLRLTAATMITAVAVHGTLAFVYPKYWDCVVVIHTQRPVTSASVQINALRSLFSDLAAGIGLFGLGTAVLANDRRLRALGFCTFVQMLLIILSRRYFASGWFIGACVGLFGCGAVYVARGVRIRRAPAAIFMAMAIVSTVSCLHLGRTAIYRHTTQRRAEQEFLGRLRSTPGTTVASLIAKPTLLAEKKICFDYYCSDTTPPPSPRPDDWFISWASRADIVVISDNLIRMLSPSQCKALLTLGNRRVFVDESVRESFDRKATQTTAISKTHDVLIRRNTMPMSPARNIVISLLPPHEVIYGAPHLHQSLDSKRRD